MGIGERLPRGRHGLSRDEVEDSQRRRILDATVEVVAERGYGETRVVDVIDAAGVSRKTFYELFGSRDDCFLAAYDNLVGGIMAEVEAAFDTCSGSWAERIRVALEVLLTQFAERPGAARVAIVEVLAAGPAAIGRRDAVLRQLSGLLDTGRSESAVELPRITSLSVAGGLIELIYSEVIHGAVARLPDRLPDIVFWVTLPYLGHERAVTERETAQGNRDREPIKPG